MIYLACKSQITLLNANKALIIISIEYSDFAKDFFEKSITLLLKYLK